MKRPTADSTGTREGVVLHRDGPFEIPPKRSGWSEAGYRALYDSDHVIVWARSIRGITRARLAGPLSANVWIRSFIDQGAEVVVLWADSSDPAADWCGSPSDTRPPEMR